MGGNSFGTLFKVTSFGESHGPALGCVVDGCPAGISLSIEDIRKELARRRPGGGGVKSERAEPDEPEILSGLYEGKTLGTPIAILVRNKDSRPEDYDYLKDVYRPGHADWPWEEKYGFRDHRGGGRSSGRETVGRVAAGAIARVFLCSQGIEILAEADYAEEEAENLKASGDSMGCSVTCTVKNLPPGLGEPVFDKLDARIAAAMLSLGAAKAIEFGAGFAVSKGRASELNDSLIAPGVWKTNNAGGVLGGISTGAELRFTVAFKPIPSIARPQQTINRRGEKTEITVRGRHDVCVAPRVIPVVEAMTALALADFVLLQRSARY